MAVAVPNGVWLVLLLVGAGVAVWRVKAQVVAGLTGFPPRPPVIRAVFGVLLVPPRPAVESETAFSHSFLSALVVPPCPTFIPVLGRPYAVALPVTQVKRRKGRPDCQATL